MLDPPHIHVALRMDVRCVQVRTVAWVSTRTNCLGKYLDKRIWVLLQKLRAVM